MADVQLDTSYLEGGIANVNFFNGRVLTAGDLRDQQAAEADHHRRLGRVTGDGVVAGLGVVPEADGTSVTVTDGLAVSRRGDVLELTASVRVPLARPAQPAGPGAGAGFVPCPTGEGGGTLAGPGAYLLVLSPASATSGQAPRVAFDAGGVAEDCGPRYTVEGVSFRLVAVDVLGLAEQVPLDAADLAVLRAEPGDQRRRQLRNVLAHLFLGTVAARALFVDPFRVGTTAGPSARGPLDELRGDGKLTDSDVPLALFTWAEAGLELVDVWAVRRRPVAGGTLTPAWSALTGPRRTAEAEAALQQFQDQLAAMTEPGAAQDPAEIRAIEHFRYLPAAGLVPTDEAGDRGFPPGQFFEGMTVLPEAAIAGAKLESLLRASLAHPPIDLATGELVFLYRVRETTELVEALTPVRPFVVFSSGNLPYQGTALEIQAVFPSGPLHEGDTIEIRGHDFGFSQGAARVFFDDIRVDPQPGSTDSKLLVVVPEALDVPEEGLRVTLKVDNGIDSDTVTVTVLLREVPPAGQLDVDWISVEPPGIDADGPADFTYRVTSRLNRTADIALTAEVDPPALRPGLELRNAAGNPIDEMARMAPDEARDLLVHLDDVGDATITLTVTARAGDIAKADVRQFEPGQPPEQPDDDIEIQINSFRVQGPGPTDPANGTYDAATATISLRANRVGMLSITGIFEAAGRFDRTLTVAGGATGWRAEFDLEVPDPIVVDPGDLLPDGRSARPLDFAVLPNVGASATGTVTLTVQRQGSTRKQTKLFNLALLA
jgi:hypothetical protein